MEPDSPVASVERTFWTVWSYVVEAVNRFFRPEPTDAATGEPNAVQDTPASSEPTDSGHSEDSPGGGGRDGEQPLAPACLLRSSGVVSWESGYGPAKQRTQSKTQQREDAESKAPEEQETKREERFDQTGSDDGGHATDEKSEEEHEKCEMHECELEEGDGEVEKHIMTDVKEEDSVNKDKAGSQGRDGRTVARHKDVEIPVSVLWTNPENENESGEGEKSQSQLSENNTAVQGDADVGQLMAHRRDRDKDEDEGDEEGVNILQDREQRSQENTTEPAHKQTTDENPEQEDESQTDKGGRQGRQSLSESVICSEEASLNVSTELHTEEEQEDVAEITKTKICEADCVNASTTYGLQNDRMESTRVDEGDKSSEEDEQGGNIEITCAPTSAAVKPEGETPQETSRELENVPLRTCEGRAVVSPGIQSTPYEETQEEVPEYNNEPDEKTSQTFLEVGDGEEIQTTQLPEEVESLQNSGSTAAAEDLLVKEQGEEQDSTERAGVPRHMDAELLQDRVKPLVEQVIQESRLLFEDEEGNILGHSMKTGIEQSEKEFGTNTVSADDRATELHIKTEELPAEFERLSDSTDSAGDGPDSAGPVAAGGLFGSAGETSKPPDAELLRIMDASVFQESDENCNMISSLLEDVTKAGFLKESAEGEPKAHGDGTAEKDVEGTGYALEEGAAEDETQNKSHLGLFDVQLVDVTAEPIKETDKNQSALPTDLDKAFEISNEEMLKDTEATNELIINELQSKGLTVTSEDEMAEAEGTYAEETRSGHEAVIDEEILDLWIQAVSSEDQIKQQEGPEQQTDTQIQQSHEEAETADMSDQQAVAECQDAADTEQSDLKEEESVPDTGFNTDSGVQEPCKSQEGSDGEHTELLENDTGSQKIPDAGITDQNNKTDWKDTEEAGVELQANSENVEEIQVEIFPNETKHYEHPKSGSGVLLEEEFKFTENSSQVDSGAQPKTSSPELHMTEVVEHPVTTFKDLLEVDASSLDFTAQRSRIALKNPRVRPPKHPRSLLHIPSLEPTPSAHQQVKVPAGVPLGGLGVGIKLPGLGTGFPVLKKTRVVAEENSPETTKEPEAKPEDNSEPPKEDEVQKKPKWMPPKHPGFGNPLMSELKTKLKKTTKE